MFDRLDTIRSGHATLIHDDCLRAVAQLPADSIDAMVTDPPYHLTSIVKRYSGTSIHADGTNERRAKAGSDAMARLSRGFMGKTWDGGDIAFRPDTWRAFYRVLKPGAHIMVFGGTRTFHRMAVAIEDAGFEIRDTLMWLYGTGFPKSHDVSKGIDALHGAQRRVTGTEKVRDIRNGHGRGLDDGINSAARNGPVYMQREITAPATSDAERWQGWGTALKPAWEPIILARKPFTGSVAANVLRYGTGALNIDACRIGSDGGGTHCSNRDKNGKCRGHPDRSGWRTYHAAETEGDVGRWPANVLHDGSGEVVAMFPDTQSTRGIKGGTNPNPMDWGNSRADASKVSGYNDSGSAARFFYSAKASKADRNGSKHPTVKPIDLIAYLQRMTTPPGGTILEPFGGSGTGIAAAQRIGAQIIAIEQDPWYYLDMTERLK